MLGFTILSLIYLIASSKEARFPPGLRCRRPRVAREQAPRWPTKRTISTKGRHRTRCRTRARTRAGTALMSRETCRVAGHRVTSVLGRSLRRMWSRWARLGHVPSGRPIVMHAYALCRTLQCTAHRRAAVARQQHPSCYPGACTGEEAQPRGIPGEVSQLVRSARAPRRHAL